MVCVPASGCSFSAGKYLWEFPFFCITCDAGEVPNQAFNLQTNECYTFRPPPPGRAHVTPGILKFPLGNPLVLALVSHTGSRGRGEVTQKKRMNVAFVGECGSNKETLCVCVSIFIGCKIIFNTTGNVVLFSFVVNPVMRDVLLGTLFINPKTVSKLRETKSNCCNILSDHLVVVWSHKTDKNHSLLP